MVLSVILCCQSAYSSSPIHAAKIDGLGLTEQDVIDAYIYIFGRYIVIRQEHIDIAEEGVDYNVIKYNELGKAEFVNPNLDVAYLEAWFAVDANTPVILNIPKIEGRYYTAQIIDEWGDITDNINERNYPETPCGKFALVLKGTQPKIPEEAVRIEIPSKKAKLLARVERQGDDKGAVKLQRSFKIVQTGKPAIEPAVAIPMFTNAKPIMVDVFKQPMLDKVLASAPDPEPAMAVGIQKKALAIAEFVAKHEANRTAVDNIIKEKALPGLVHFIRNYGDKRGGWVATTGKPNGPGDDYWFRTAGNYLGLWYNTNKEVVYYIGEMDDSGEPLNGDHVYVVHFKKADFPQERVHAYWSLTMLSMPDYRVIPNRLDRFNINNVSKLEYEANGDLRLYLASDLPKGAPETNWLPTSKGHPFSMNLRLYVPKQEVITGEYFVPPIKKVN